MVRGPSRVQGEPLGERVADGFLELALADAGPAGELAHSGDCGGFVAVDATDPEEGEDGHVARLLVLARGVRTGDHAAFAAVLAARAAARCSGVTGERERVARSAVVLVCMVRTP